MIVIMLTYLRSFSSFGALLHFFVDFLFQNSNNWISNEFRLWIMKKWISKYIKFFSASFLLYLSTPLKKFGVSRHPLQTSTPPTLSRPNRVPTWKYLEGTEKKFWRYPPTLTRVSTWENLEGTPAQTSNQTPLPRYPPEKLRLPTLLFIICTLYAWISI